MNKKGGRERETQGERERERNKGRKRERNEGRKRDRNKGRERERNKWREGGRGGGEEGVAPVAPHSLTRRQSILGDAAMTGRVGKFSFQQATPSERIAGNYSLHLGLLSPRWLDGSHDRSELESLAEEKEATASADRKGSAGRSAPQIACRGLHAVEMCNSKNFPPKLETSRPCPVTA